MLRASRPQINDHYREEMACAVPWCFALFEDNWARLESTVLGRVVKKPINADPGLKVNQSINFSCIKMFFASYFLFSLRLFKFKSEIQTI